MANDKPFNIEEQIEAMRKYVIFYHKTKMRKFLTNIGYFRASRYGKYLLSHSNILAMKPSQDILFELYEFDFQLRKIMYEACAKAEIQIKTVISNAVSIKTGDAGFYLDENNYTATRSERNKYSRNKNIHFFKRFISDVQTKEEKLRKDMLKYPELKEYRSGGKRAMRDIPSWAAFFYFEFGTIINIYMYLRGDLRKEVLVYGYGRGTYGKKITTLMDTWINGIRTLRNICAHHSRLVGVKGAIVLQEDEDILDNGEDLFSRLYALKKVMNQTDSEDMKQKLIKLISKTKLDIYQLEILPEDWVERYDRIKYL